MKNTETLYTIDMSTNLTLAGVSEEYLAALPEHPEVYLDAALEALCLRNGIPASNVISLEGEITIGKNRHVTFRALKNGGHQRFIRINWGSQSSMYHDFTVDMNECYHLTTRRATQERPYNVTYIVVNNYGTVLDSINIR